jgi:hypothetical protein
MMWWNVGVLLLLFVANGFGQAVSEPVDFAPDENPRYFPIGVFAEGGSDGSFRARW